MPEFPAIVMIGYSRWATLGLSLQRLAECLDVEKHDCFLYLDAPYRPEDSEDCLKMFQTAKHFQKTRLPNLSIIRRANNIGVPGNHIRAITETLTQYGKVIFFEDDILVSRTFLRYMDRALDLYENDSRIFCINGFKNPRVHVPRSYSANVYLTPRNMAWGFGIWRNRWDGIDFELKDWPYRKLDEDFVRRLECVGNDVCRILNDQYEGRVHTWDVQCTYHMVVNGLYSIEPRYSLTKCIGFGQGSLHCKDVDYCLAHMKYYDYLPVLSKDIEPDGRILKSIQSALKTKSLLGRITRRLNSMRLRFAGQNSDPMETHGKKKQI